MAYGDARRLSGRGIPDVVRRASVPIRECTSDNGVHVHRNAISMCAPALPYVAGCLTVAARPPERRRRSGAFGRRWERPPPFGDASIGIGEGWHVHTHATLPRGVAPIHGSLREGCRSDAETRDARPRGARFGRSRQRAATRAGSCSGEEGSTPRCSASCSGVSASGERHTE